MLHFNRQPSDRPASDLTDQGHMLVGKCQTCKTEIEVHPDKAEYRPGGWGGDATVVNRMTECPKCRAAVIVVASQKRVGITVVKRGVLPPNRLAGKCVYCRCEVEVDRDRLADLGATDDSIIPGEGTPNQQLANAIALMNDPNRAVTIPCPTPGCPRRICLRAKKD